MDFFDYNQDAYFEYVPFSSKNPQCLHVVLSQRAYNTILAETFAYDGLETGGVLIGHIYRRIWYVTDAIPPGMNARHTRAHFHLDLDFVNFLADKVGDIYKYRPTILGIWHRHPGSMDVFSQEDFNTIHVNEQSSRFGILSMLVNIDPDVRMTFYHARNGMLMKVHYDHGDEYFPVGLLGLATPQELLDRRKTNEGGRGLKIAPHLTLDPQRLPRTMDMPTPRPINPRPMDPPAPAVAPVDASVNNQNRENERQDNPPAAHGVAGFPFVPDERLNTHTNSPYNNNASDRDIEDNRENEAQQTWSDREADIPRQGKPANEEILLREKVLSRLDREELPGVWDQVDNYVRRRTSVSEQGCLRNPALVLGYGGNHLDDDIINDLIDVLDAWGIADGNRVKEIKGIKLDQPEKTQKFFNALSKEIPNGVVVMYAYELWQNRASDNAIWDVVNNSNGIFPILICFPDDYRRIVEEAKKSGIDALNIYIGG